MADTAADFQLRGVEFFHAGGKPGLRCKTPAVRDAVMREIARRVLALSDWSPGMVARLAGLPTQPSRRGVCDCCDDAFGPLPDVPHPTGDYRGGWCELCTAAVRSAMRARGLLR